jgi:ribulose-phosphate 3-epimerase
MKVSPSLISCKLEELKEEIHASVEGGAEYFHLDIMDGHFVPNLTMGPDLIKAIRRCTDLPLEAHMMITDPDKYWKSFSKAGADILMFHYETPINLKQCFREVTSEGKQYGIVINPDTPFNKISDLLENASVLLIMSVYPGFSGQKFIPGVLPKIKEARTFIDENGLKTEIEVDGGINNETGLEVKNSGVHRVVSASYIYEGDIRERIKMLRSI